MKHSQKVICYWMQILIITGSFQESCHALLFLKGSHLLNETIRSST